MWLTKAAVLPPLQALGTKVLEASANELLKFILDPTSIPEVVTMHQEFGMPVLELVFYMTRTFAYSLHRKKLILTDKWPYAILNLCHTITNTITFFRYR